MQNITSKHPELKSPIYEGLFAAIMTGAGEAYLSAYAISLGATAMQAGMVTALPPVIGSIFLLFTINRLLAIRSRKLTLRYLTLFQALTWIPIAGLYFTTVPELRVEALLVLTIIHFGIGSLLSPIWNSLMGDIVPQEIRGTYFGGRNRVVLLSSLIATTSAGVILQLTNSWEMIHFGYSAIFLTVFIARLASSQILLKYPDPPNTAQSSEKFTFIGFIRRSHRSNFLKFTTFVGIYNLTVFISAPFISFYLLNDLQYSYVEYTIIVSSTTLFQLIAMQRWGKLSDEFGTKAVMICSCIGYSLSEFLWLLSSEFWYVLICRSISGYLWAGFTLSSSAFIFDSVTPQKRMRCIAYQNVINHTCIIFGTLLGSAIISCIPYSSGFPTQMTGNTSNILVLFLISGAMRLVTLSSLITFSEVRNVPNIKASDFIFRLLHLRPIVGSQLEILSSSPTNNAVVNLGSTNEEIRESDSGV